MARTKNQRLPPKPGWAIYLRTSDEEMQNPENSQRRQRQAIARALLESSELPVIGEYIDNISGRTAYKRSHYQRMLDDARAGLFSHVAVENAERFGRNDSEAMRALDELDELGIAVRFADYPDLDPIDPDDRILVTLSFTLARRESIKLGQRVKGGLRAKQSAGGCITIAPDGYVNLEEKTPAELKQHYGKHKHWVEPDPKRRHIWREAWDLLLEERYSLEDICIKLHERGYTYRSGRAFIQMSSTGRRKANYSTLARAFRNWFYAGWVVSEDHGILPKTLKGQWEPIISTEEFERGLAILDNRANQRRPRYRHDYLLQGLVYVQLPDKNKPNKLSGSTPNASRKGGGTSYYCLTRDNINIPCNVVDEQIVSELNLVQVDSGLIPVIRDAYSKDLAEKLGHVIQMNVSDSKWHSKR